MAMAYPTFNAETGIVALPNALTAKDGSLAIAADVMFTDTNTVKARVIYGLNNRIEVGASLTAGNTNGGSISAKYRITDDVSRFNFAAGASLTFDNHTDNVLDAYLAATQAFATVTDARHPILGTLGVHLINVNSDNTLRPFVGVQIPMGNRTQLGAEYQLKGGDLFTDPLTSVVLRHNFDQAWTGQVGATNAIGGGSGDTHTYRLFIGAQYTFAK